MHNLSLSLIQHQQPKSLLYCDRDFHHWCAFEISPKIIIFKVLHQLDDFISELWHNFPFHLTPKPNFKPQKLICFFFTHTNTWLIKNFIAFAICEVVETLKIQFSSPDLHFLLWRIWKIPKLNIHHNSMFQDLHFNIWYFPYCICSHLHKKLLIFQKKVIHNSKKICIFVKIN